MSDRIKVDTTVEGDDTTTTVQLTVQGDVQVTVVLDKPGNQGQEELVQEAICKAIELLQSAASR
ncbi:hypothetical protein [Stenotrophomonas sp.]|jgi:hypothetical protein|uniref:hypothetical protein n=1 Tax=Stenotrophomonas sp. TaxID=69392 RepID=UPI00289ED259|nr:hypothetical protein [Stenotrophomonas sp.]